MAGHSGIPTGVGLRKIRGWRILERLALSLGLMLLAVYTGAFVHRQVGSTVALSTFETQQRAQPADRRKDEGVDFGLWSEKLIKAPVFPGTGELVLNRGVGWIPGTPKPGESGNSGIAGDRDGFFRALKDVAIGDVIELHTRGTRFTHRVDHIETVLPENVGVLRPGGATRRRTTVLNLNELTASSKGNRRHWGYVTAKEAYEMWTAEPEKVIILDVRTREEFLFVGHPPMAWKVPIAAESYEWDTEKGKFPMTLPPDFVSRVSEAAKPTDTILAMCRSGGLSAIAVNMLAKAGFEHAYNIIDGMEGDTVDDPASVFHGQRLKNWRKNSGAPGPERMLPAQGPEEGLKGKTNASAVF